MNATTLYKTLIVLLFTFGLLNHTKAQVISNTNFEEWSPSGSPAPFDWEFPTNWTSNNATTEFTSAGVQKTTDSYEGTFAAQLTTVNAFGEFTPAMIVNGDGDLNFGEFSVEIITAGDDLGTVPVAVSGYYKFSSTSDGDSGEAVLLLKKYNADLDKQDTVLLERKLLPPQEEYTLFSFDIEPLTESPDSIILAFYSTRENEPLAGGQLLIDEVSMGVTGITDSELSEFQIYPNPTNGIITIESNKSDNMEITVRSLTGEKVFRDKMNEAINQIDLTYLNKGIYFVEIIVDDNGWTKKLIIR